MFSKYLLLLVFFSTLLSAKENILDSFFQPQNQTSKDGYPETELPVKKEKTISKDGNVYITVTGQGVAPMFARNHAQKYLLAKRAATADAYRLIAEQIKGVKIKGKDTIKNMALQSSTIEAEVSALVRNAKIVDTRFQDGLCEVEMEINVNLNRFMR